ASNFEVDTIERGQTAEADCQQLRAEERSWNSRRSGQAARSDRCIRSHLGRVPVMLKAVAPRAVAGLCPRPPRLLYLPASFKATETRTKPQRICRALGWVER